MSRPELPDDIHLTPPFGVHHADATIARIVERLLAMPRHSAVWQEAAALNAAQRPLAAAFGRGEIDHAAYQERLRLVAGPVLARADSAAAEILVAATLLLQAEAATLRPNSLN